MLLPRGFRFEVVWLGDAVGAGKPDLLEVNDNLPGDHVMVVGDHDLVTVQVQIVEPRILGLCRGTCVLGALELHAEATELQVVVHDHEVRGALSVALHLALNSQSNGGLELAKSSRHLGMWVEASYVIDHLEVDIVF